MNPAIAALVHAAALLQQPVSPAEMECLPPKQAAQFAYKFWETRERHLKLHASADDIKEIQLRKATCGHIINIYERGTYPSVPGNARDSLRWLWFNYGPPQTWNFFVPLTY